VLALWATLILPRQRGWPDVDKRRYVVLVALIFLYAVSDEWHQSLTPHRDASACDVFTDVVGASLTAAAIAFAGGPRASDRNLARVFLFGIPLVFAAGALATFGPTLLADLTGA